MLPKTIEDVRQFIIDNSRTENIKYVEYRKDKNKRNRLWLGLECTNGHQYEQEWYNFRTGYSCKVCGYKKSGETQTKYSLEYVKKILKRRNFKMINESEYVNSGVAFAHECLKCGNKSRSNFKHILDGRNCRTCIGHNKKTTEQFSEEVNEMTDGEYEVVGDYINNKVHIKVKHSICGNVYGVSPSNFLRGKRCPKCKSSRGEMKIREYLLKRACDFQEQYRIDECRNIRPLSFDFAIFDDNDRLVCLVEFDGKQHFEVVEYFGGKEYFENIQKNDLIKNMYCKDNNIKLIRIPYYDFENIQDILQSELKEEFDAGFYQK